MSETPPAPPELRDEAVRLAVEIRMIATDIVHLRDLFDELGLLIRRQAIQEADEILERLRRHRAGVDSLGKTLKEIRDDIAAAKTNPEPTKS